MTVPAPGPCPVVVEPRVAPFVAPLVAPLVAPFVAPFVDGIKDMVFPCCVAFGVVLRARVRCECSVNFEHLSLGGQPRIQQQTGKGCAILGVLIPLYFLEIAY